MLKARKQLRFAHEAFLHRQVGANKGAVKKLNSDLPIQAALFS